MISRKLKCDLFPQSASCKCYFFDNLGEWRPNQAADGSDCRFNDVLRRSFLRQVRLNERRKRNQGDNQRRGVSDLKNKDETEQLRASVDFLAELCESVSPVEKSNFANWSHQAVDFILASMKNLLSMGKDMEIIEGIVCSLVMRLVGKMCSALQGNESLHTEADDEFYIQHVIRKLGVEAYIGHRVILFVSQRISILAESLLFLDPFDNAFPHMHECLFTMIQLIEFLVSDNLTTWSADEDFDHVLFEEWVVSVLHARKALLLMESRNGLYVLYMDRVTGELAKRVSHIPLLQNINSNIHENLFC
ncbi:protein MULTIPOLAR SPINDLE 1 isoform X2 [Tripterygium wilfordii]|uniref:protein MULTIPOLAR SPINDLE 1 isoform X2 n=1 Tax=Tripterygium wilfordii TaxID=458696 RepID=UPI0018F838BB|nr:protein MULTIPOLAR SPINDLE 1 isoform X2 [Tripterygium wilfordii]